MSQYVWAVDGVWKTKNGHFSLNNSLTNEDKANSFVLILEKKFLENANFDVFS